MTMRIVFSLLAICLSVGAGCFGVGGDSSISVTGQVTVGSAVWKDGGSVLFQSDMTSETAALDSHGRFAMRIPPGIYRVAVEPAGGIPVERPDPRRGGILAKYMMPSTSGITVSIDDDHRDLAIELDGAGG
jgi:hypothetical protein